MLNCEKVLSSLYDYLDKESDSSALTEIKKHLDLCRECYDRADFEKILREHMRAKTSRPCPEEVKKKIQSLLEMY